MALLLADDQKTKEDGAKTDRKQVGPIPANHPMAGHSAIDRESFQLCPPAEIAYPSQTEDEEDSATQREGNQRKPSIGGGLMGRVPRQTPVSLVSQDNQAIEREEPTGHGAGERSRPQTQPGQHTATTQQQHMELLGLQNDGGGSSQQPPMPAEQTDDRGGRHRQKADRSEGPASAGTKQCLREGADNGGANSPGKEKASTRIGRCGCYSQQGPRQ